MRREILKLSAGWVLCAAAWAACGGEKIVARKELGFEITVPVDADSNSHSVSWSGNWYFGSVKVYHLKENDGLRSFFTIPDHQDQLKSSTVTDIGIIKLDGRNAIKLTVEQGGFYWTHYYTVAGGRGYAFLIVAGKKNFDAAIKDFDAIVASFKIIEAK